MPITLPTEPVKPTRISPRIAIFYSLPKVGKTWELAHLPGCLILDAEGGAEGYECLRFAVSCTKDLLDARDAIIKMGEDRAAKGYKGADVYPYSFIALDTIDKMEEYAEESATTKYRKGPLNSKKKFEENGFTTVTELPDGNGYQYLRNELLMIVNEIAAVCPRLIITCHVKDKKVIDKKGETIIVSDLSLTGKMGAILCSKADVIGYMYRSEAKENRGELMVSFETYESAVMGARQKYLAGKKFPFSWARIYPDVFPDQQESEWDSHGQTSAGPAPIDPKHAQMADTLK